MTEIVFDLNRKSDVLFINADYQLQVKVWLKCVYWIEMANYTSKILLPKSVLSVKEQEIK